MGELTATISQESMYDFDSQAKQFHKKGKPGPGYETHEVAGFPVECWLYRNTKGHLVGILYHYPEGGPTVPIQRLNMDGEVELVVEPIESPGNVNIFVRPDRQRRGIGTRLVEKYERKRGPIDWSKQRLTPQGVEFARKMNRRLVVPSGRLPS